MQSFLDLFKRCIQGTYVAVEPKHLYRYVEEEAFRFNAREVTEAERFMGVVSNAKDKRPTYKQLIGA